MEPVECAICLELLEDDIAILTCNHKFHFECITSWMNCKNNYTNFCVYCDMDNEIINVINARKNSNNTNQSQNIVNSNPLPPLPPLRRTTTRQLPPIPTSYLPTQQMPQPEKKCTIL